MTFGELVSRLVFHLSSSSPSMLVRRWNEDSTAGPTSFTRSCLRRGAQTHHLAVSTLERLGVHIAKGFTRCSMGLYLFSEYAITISWGFLRSIW